MIIVRQKEYGRLIDSDVKKRGRKFDDVRKRFLEGNNTVYDKNILEKLKNRVERTTPIVKDGIEAGFEVEHHLKPYTFVVSKDNIDRNRLTHLGKKVHLENPENLANLAHEYGHALDFASKGGHSRSIDGIFFDGEKDFFGDVRTSRKHLTDGRIKIRYETNASKNGLKILRKLEASPEDMKKTRENLKDALGTYYSAEESLSSQAAKLGNMSDKEYFKQKLTDNRRLKRDYKKAIKEIETAGRTGAERAYEASQRSGVENAGRAIKKTLLKNDVVRHAVEKASQAGDKTKKKIIKKVFKHLIK